MEFDETLDISDLIKCADNFYKTMQMAQDIESGHTIIDDDSDFLHTFARSAAIQVFEITVESAWKMMQRWVKINADNKIHEKPKRELFRTAHQSGLIDNPVVWWTFFDGRNKTSHTYHEETAEEVYALAKTFGAHLQDFTERLQARV